MELWLSQARGQWYSAALTKARKPFRFFVELFLPFLVLALNNGIKNYIRFGSAGTTDPIPGAIDALLVPSLDDLIVFPEAKDIENPEAPGYWYLTNLAEFWDHGAGNLAYTCSLNSARFKYTKATTFFELCEELKFAVVPKDKKNPDQVTAANEFKDFLTETTNFTTNMIRRLQGVEKIEDASDITSYIQSEIYGTESQPRLGAVVVFDSPTSYTIHVNRTVGEYMTFLRFNTTHRGPGIPDLFRAPGTPSAWFDILLGPMNGENIPNPERGLIDLLPGRTEHSKKYLLSGYLSMQMAVDEYILSRETGSRKTVQSSIIPIPTNDSGFDLFWQVTGLVFPILVALASLVSPVMFTIDMMADKESKFRELMFVMGLRPSAYYFGNYLLALMFSFLGAAEITGMNLAGEIMKESSAAVVFVVALFFFLAEYAYTFFIMTFFQRTSVAIIGVVTLQVGGLLLFLFVQSKSYAVQLFCSLLHPVTAFGLISSVFRSLESKGTGLQWSNLSLPTEDTDFTGKSGLTILIVQAVGFLLLCGYFDSIIGTVKSPGRAPWHWPFSCLIRKSGLFDSQSLYQKAVATLEARESRASTVDEAFEQVSEVMRMSRREGNCVVFDNVSKEFNTATGKVYALQNNTFSVFEGQVTALLGSNGCGKTTTSSILTGILRETSGNIFAFGKATKTHRAEIQSLLGVCPQDDVFNASLTVEDHLHLIASIKGVDRRYRKNRVKRVIAEAGLKAYFDFNPGALSGGTKRKLQLAMALLDAKILVLDEPTSGLDVSSRDHVQQTIAKYRSGRVIIFTTHFMDEADVLADQIAFISNGRVKYQGTSLFLKELFGVGYNLTLSGESTVDVNLEAMNNVVTKYIPEAELTSVAGSEVKFKLPIGAGKAISSLLVKLEKESSTFRLASTPTLAVTNLESVFLRIQQEDIGYEPVQEKKAVKNIVGNKPEVLSDSIFDAETLPPGIIECIRLLLRKRFLGVIRNKVSFFIQFFLPLLLLLFGLLAPPGDFRGKKTNMTFNENTMVWGDNVKSPVFGSGQLAEEILPHFQMAAASKLAYLDSGKTYKETIFCMSELESMAIAIDSSFLFEVIAYISPGFEELPWPVLNNPNQFYVPPKEYRFNLSSYYPACDTFDPVNYGKFTKRYLSRLTDEEEDVLGSFVIFDKDNAGASVGIAFNYTGIHTVPLFMNRINAALASSWASKPVNISAGVETLPDTLPSEKVLVQFGYLLSAVVIGIAFALLPSSFAFFVGREIELGSFELQLINGVPSIAYWASTFLFDFFLMAIAAIVTVILVFAHPESGLAENGLALIILLFAYSIAVLPFTYCLGQLTGSGSISQTGYFILALVGVGVFGIGTFMSYLNRESWINIYIDEIGYRFLPAFPLFRALLRLSNLQFFNIALNSPERLQDPTHPITYTAFSSEIAGLDIAMLFADFLLYSSILAVTQPAFLAKLAKRKSRLYFSTVEDPGIAVEDEDVSQERVEVEQLSNRELSILSQSDNVKAAASRLRKVYNGNFVAVESLSLRLKKDECFGLLGNNGAGKSTITKMLVGGVIPTEGVASIDGLDATRDQTEAHRILGYCAQTECLFEHLTAREHLRFYGRVKGIPTSLLGSVTTALLDQLRLTPFADKPAGGYSGGNKRKLSVAIAVLGNPKLVLLDEPTTGVDPGVRKQIVSFSKNLAKKASMMLITHSMEECEALCGRVGILVDGALRCLGSVSRIKSLYGNGYQMEATFKAASRERLMNILRPINVFDGNEMVSQELVRECFEHTFPDRKYETSELFKKTGKLTRAIIVADIIYADLKVLESATTLREVFHSNVKVIDFRGLHIRIEIPLESKLSFPDMFQYLEANREVMDIQEFALSQITLEKIFNDFAKTKYAEKDGRKQKVAARRQPMTRGTVVPRIDTDF